MYYSYTFTLSMYYNCPDTATMAAREQELEQLSSKLFATQARCSQPLATLFVFFGS